MGQKTDAYMNALSRLSSDGAHVGYAISQVADSIDHFADVVGDKSGDVGLGLLDILKQLIPVAGLLLRDEAAKGAEAESKDATAMAVYCVNEGDYARHWVIAGGADAAIAVARRQAVDRGFTESEVLSRNLSVVVLDSSIPLRFFMESGPGIEHTCEDWLLIYGNEERYLGCSESGDVW